MPILPRYISQQPVEAGIRLPPRVAAPDVGQAIIQSWGPAAREWEETQDRIQRAQDVVELAKLDSAIRQDMETVSENLTKSGDPVNRGQRFFETMQPQIETRLAAYRNADPLFQERARAHATSLVGQRTPQEQAHGFGLQLDRVRGEAVAQTDEMIQRGIRGTSADAAEASASLASLWRGAVQAGAETAPRAEAIIASSVEKIRQGNVKSQALTIVEGAPREALRNLLAFTQDAEGRITRSYLPDLSEQDRYALAGHARELIRQEETDARVAMNEAERLWTGKLANDLLRGAYNGPDGRPDRRLVLAQTEGHPIETVSHIESLVNEYERRTGKTDDGASRALRSRYNIQLFEAKPGQRDSIYRRAQIDNANESLTDQDMEIVTKTYDRLIYRDQAMEDRNLRRMEAEERRAEAERLRRLRQRAGIARAEMLSWVPGTRDPGAKFFTDDINNVKEDGYSIIQTAIDMDRDPVEAVRAWRPGAIASIYGGAENAIRERRGKLSEWGIRGPDDLKRLRDRMGMDNPAYLRAAELAMELSQIETFLPNYQPQLTGREQKALTK